MTPAFPLLLSPERTALSLKITPKQANGRVLAGSVPEKVADSVNGTRKKITTADFKDSTTNHLG
jgi:hypothetical protein